MKILVLSDIHIMLTNPLAWQTSYSDALVETFRWIKRQALKHKVDMILCAGDVFDKSILRKPSEIVASIMFAIDYLPKMSGVIGNHDLVGNTMDNLSRSMIGPVISSGVYTMLSKPTVVGDVSIYGFNYGEEFTGPNKDDDSKYKIAVWHQLVSKTDGEFPGAISAGSVVREYNGKYNLIITGDNHQRFEVAGKDTWLMNPGSLMRINAAQLDYKPCIQIIDTDENCATAVPIPFKVEDVSRDHLNIDMEQEERFALLAEKIQENGQVSIDFIENMRNYIRELPQLDKSVVEFITEAMEETL